MKYIKKKWLFPMVAGLIVLIITVIVIVNLFFAEKELTTMKLNNEDIYIYFSEEKFDFTGNILLDYNNNITNISLDGNKTKLFSEPIYYSKRAEIILPVDYSITFPASACVQKKVGYYSSIKKIDDDYYLNGNGVNQNISNNFLFDGKDYYIFINDSKVLFGDNSYDISPLSYVNYVYDTKDLYIYNYDNDELYYFDNVDDNVYVENEYYKVNLTSDSVVVNGKDKLLMKNFDYLKKLK